MPRQLKALDLFCGAGCAARGLIAAGFKVTGVDIKKQPNYPGEFFHADALQHFDAEWIWAHFDFVWASPPCQRYTALRHAKHAKEHPNLIPQTRALLKSTGLPYCIENVPAAPLENAFTLCGSMFGLGVAGYQLRRHRKFETNFAVTRRDCKHQSPVIGVYGGHVRCRAKAHGGRRTRDFDGENKHFYACCAMGLEGLDDKVQHLTMNEISQGIPPAYAEHIGLEAIRLLHSRGVGMP